MTEQEREFLDMSYELRDLRVNDKKRVVHFERATKQTSELTKVARRLGLAKEVLATYPDAAERYEKIRQEKRAARIQADEQNKAAGLAEQARVTEFVKQ